MKALLLSFAAFLFFFSSARCMAQDVAPVIYLSPEEAARAKQTLQDFISAQDRDKRATTAWQSFNQVFQAAHPELPNLRFSSDFRVAFARRNRANFPFEDEAATIELSAEDRTKAESLYRETTEARRLAGEARKNWSDYQYQIVLNHFPPEAGGMILTLPSGKPAMIPSPWSSGIVVTPDFRAAFPK